MRTAVYRDWSGLPEDLILSVMRELAIPDLLHAGAVCVSWRAACAVARLVQFPIVDAAPCLLYSCAAADADDTAMVYSISTGAAFKVRLLAPALRSRHVVGSGHCWIVTVDEESKFQALNPLTGAQVDLPPVMGLDEVERFSADQARLLRPGELQRYIYLAYLSCRPTAGSTCAILLVHQGDGLLYFAHVGDGRWARIADLLPVDVDFHSAVYNKHDGLFYVLSRFSWMCALDLSGQSPVLRAIFTGCDEAIDRWPGGNRLPWGNIALAPWADILQVWRSKQTFSMTPPAVDIPASHKDDILLCKFDFDAKKIVKISPEDLRGHALFLGFNASMCLSTKDFPGLKPNHTYLTNGAWKKIFLNKFGPREVGIWNFETNTLESLGKVQSEHPWLNWPSPIWITPSLS